MISLLIERCQLNITIRAQGRRTFILEVFAFISSMTRTGLEGNGAIKVAENLLLSWQNQFEERDVNDFLDICFVPIWTDVNNAPASILYKSTAGRYRPVSYPDGPITTSCRFIKNAYCGIVEKKVYLIYSKYSEKKSLSKQCRSELDAAFGQVCTVVIHSCFLDTSTGCKTIFVQILGQIR